MNAGCLREHDSGCSLAVRAQPGAKKTAMTGVYGQGDSEAIKVSVQAPPVEGRANDVLIAYLAKVFGLSRSSVSILHGELGRRKLVLLRGMKVSQAKAILDRHLQS